MTVFMANPLRYNLKYQQVTPLFNLFARYVERLLADLPRSD